jgi:hypothetical protein
LKYIHYFHNYSITFNNFSIETIYINRNTFEIMNIQKEDETSNHLSPKSLIFVKDQEFLER